MLLLKNISKYQMYSVRNLSTEVLKSKRSPVRNLSTEGPLNVLIDLCFGLGLGFVSFGLSCEIVKGFNKIVDEKVM